jgi:hypothetical protein
VAAQCLDDPKSKEIRSSPEPTKKALEFYNKVVEDGR